MSGRCGPLCQHPGCWHSSQTPQGTSNSYYLNYLSRLASRKSRKTSDRQNSRGQSPTLTEDGLPTLKVQTLDQDHMTAGLNAVRRHTRAHSLPPVKTSSRNGSSLGPCPFVHSKENKGVHFLQMHLEEEEPVYFDDLTEVVYSPVLIWKPGKQPHIRHTTHPPHTYTSAHIPLPSHPSPDSPSYSPQVSRPLSRHSPSPSDYPRSKSPLHLKRTDLTNALPPDESSSELLLKREERGASHQRVTTADAENFSYLGDIPPQVVADIIQQLRSESTSNLDQTLPAASLDRGNPPLAPSHLPSSLTYDLSEKKLSRSKRPPAPKIRTTSFSRELSKRPLEVLRKKSSDNTQLKPISEEGPVKETRDRTLKAPPIHLTTIQPPLPAIRGSVRPMEPLLQRQMSASLTEHRERDQLPVETSLQQISPRTINLEIADSAAPQDNKRIVQKRSKSRVLTPSYSSPRPFSEEASTTTPKPIGLSRVETVDSQRVLSSTSPDFMLVGAHFTGDHLVLVDRGDKIVHQLTDTDSDANVLLQPAPQSDGLDTRDTCNTVDRPNSGVEPPPSAAVENGVRPPPSTAVEDGIRPPPSAAVENGVRPPPSTAVEDGIRPPPSTAVEDGVRPSPSTTTEDEVRPPPSKPDELVTNNPDVV